MSMRRHKVAWTRTEERDKQCTKTAATPGERLGGRASEPNHTRSRIANMSRHGRVERCGHGPLVHTHPGVRLCVSPRGDAAEGNPLASPPSCACRWTQGDPHQAILARPL